MTRAATTTPTLPRNKYNLNAISHDSAIGLIRDTIQRALELGK